MQRLAVAGEQVAVAVGDAGHGARCGAVGGIAVGLVGEILPELPAAIRPGIGHLRLFAMVGEPEIAARQDRVGADRFFQPDAYLSIDYAAQEVEGWRLVKRDGTKPRIEGGSIPVERDEPLRRELADFVGAIRERRAPVVDGAAGRRALELATRIAEKMESV